MEPILYDSKVGSPKADFDGVEQVALHLAGKYGYGKPPELIKAFIKQAETRKIFAFTPKGQMLFKPTKALYSDWGKEVKSRPDVSDFWFIKDTLCRAHYHNFMSINPQINDAQEALTLYSMFYSLKTGKAGHMWKLLAQSAEDWVRWEERTKLIKVGNSYLILVGKGERSDG